MSWQDVDWPDAFSIICVGIVMWHFVFGRPRLTRREFKEVTLILTGYLPYPPPNRPSLSRICTVTIEATARGKT